MQQNQTKMFKAFLFVAFVLGCNSAYPFQPVPQPQGGNGLPLPPPPSRPETTVEHGSQGSYVGHKQTVLDNDRFKVDSTVFASRPDQRNSPWTKGGQLDLTHKPSESVFTINAQNTRGYGTDLSSSAGYNFYRTPDKQGTLTLGGSYDRHYGGPGGTGSPSYGVFIRGNYGF